MTKKPDFTATIRNPERRGDWLTIYGTDTVPIKSPNPQKANLPGIPGTLVYMADLTVLTPDQRQRLVTHIAKRFDLDPTEVEAKLDEEGVPILADDVTVTINRPELFL